MSEPRWLVRARQDLNNAEDLGPNDSAWIRGMLKKLRASWLLGQPWCGGAVGLWMQDSGFSLPKHWYRAKAWLEWGTPLDAPAVGAVVIFDRQGGGHVGLIVGQDERGRLMVLGGNQGDAVRISPFVMQRVLGYRWPTVELASLVLGRLPLLTAAGVASSTNEA